MLFESLGIFSNFGAEKPPLLQAAKRSLPSRKKRKGKTNEKKQKQKKKS